MKKQKAVWVAAALFAVSATQCNRAPFSQGGPAGASSELPPGAVLVGNGNPANAAKELPDPAPGPSGSPPSALPAVPVVPPGAASAPQLGARGGSLTPFAPMSFAPLAKAVDPGVVTIKSLIEGVGRGGRRRVMGEGIGTGFVYDKNGLILTNNHVIEDSGAISAKFADGRELAATVVGADKHTDVALLRVDAKDLTMLMLGDSDAIDVGDWVVAIGNPFDLSHTVSAGILSAKGRTLDDVKGLDRSGYYNFLQTDAAINQGNSGGPLINLRGEVVGINTAIRAGANNIGFAIPINMVKQLLPLLVRDGKVVRSALGVLVDPLNEAEAVRLKRANRKGAWVKMVVPGGSADRAGLAADDVIVGFEGKMISGPEELRWTASIAGVGKTVSVRVQRGERTFDVRVTLGALPEQHDDDEREVPFGHP